LIATIVCNTALPHFSSPDWFLPGKNELNLWYLNIGDVALAPNTNIGNLSTSDSYRSSSQNNSNGAWSMGLLA
jgi:hypothetical protein